MYILKQCEVAYQKGLEGQGKTLDDQAFCLCENIKSWTIHVSVSPCWSLGSQGQTGLAWQPAPSQYPHRNTGKPDRMLPGPVAFPVAMSWEHWELKKKTSTHMKLLISGKH